MSSRWSESPMRDLATLGPDEVAQLIGASEWWVREQARRRKIPHLRLGRDQIKFRRTDVVALMGSWPKRQTPTGWRKRRGGRSRRRAGQLGNCCRASSPSERPSDLGYVRRPDGWAASSATRAASMCWLGIRWLYLSMVVVTDS